MPKKICILGLVAVMAVFLVFVGCAKKGKEKPAAAAGKGGLAAKGASGPMMGEEEMPGMPGQMMGKGGMPGQMMGKGGMPGQMMGKGGGGMMPGIGMPGTMGKTTWEAPTAAAPAVTLTPTIKRKLRPIEAARPDPFTYIPSEEGGVEIEKVKIEKGAPKPEKAIKPTRRMLPYLLYSVGAPTPTTAIPTEMIPPTVQRRPFEQEPAMLLGGVLMTPDKKMAIIERGADRLVVSEGDKVGNYTVEKIEKDKVILKDEETGKTLEIVLKKAEGVTGRRTMPGMPGMGPGEMPGMRPGMTPGAGMTPGTTPGTGMVPGTGPGRGRIRLGTRTSEPTAEGTPRPYMNIPRGRRVSSWTPGSGPPR